MNKLYMVKKSPGFKKLCKTKKRRVDLGISSMFYSNSKIRKLTGQVGRWDCGGSNILNGEGYDSRYKSESYKIPGDRRPNNRTSIGCERRGNRNDQDLTIPTGNVKRSVPSYKKLRVCTRKAFNDINKERVKRGMTDLRKDPKAFKEWQNKVIPVVIGPNFQRAPQAQGNVNNTYDNRFYFDQVTPVANLRVCDAYSYKLAKEGYLDDAKKERKNWLPAAKFLADNTQPYNISRTKQFSFKKKRTKKSRWRGIQMGGKTRKKR